MKALSPAKVKEVRIVNETGTAEVVVPDYQLSVAIGKEGQNARLAARLTGWRVDIKSESQLFEEEQNPVEEEWAAGEWITDESGEMVWQPAEGGEAVSASDAGYGEAEASADEAPEADEKPGRGRSSADAEASAGAAEPRTSRPECRRRSGGGAGARRHGRRGARGGRRCLTSPSDPIRPSAPASAAAARRGRPGWSASPATPTVSLAVGRRGAGAGSVAVRRVGVLFRCRRPAAGVRAGAALRRPGA